MFMEMLQGSDESEEEEMNCEEYVIARIKALENEVNGYKEQIADREEEIRIMERRIMEYCSLQSILGIRLQKDQEGDEFIELNTLYGWNHKDREKIERIKEIFGLKSDDE